MILDDFYDELRRQDRSENTITGYGVVLRQFQRWIEESSQQQFSPELVTPLDVKEWRRYLEDEKRLKPGSINQKLSNLSFFFAWCVSQEIIAQNPCENIKKLRHEALKPRWLTRKETYALLRTCQQEIQVAQSKGNQGQLRISIRNNAMVSVMLNAGLRISEVVKLQPDDVTINERSGSVTIRHGKGRKYRDVPLNLDARRALSAWIEIRKDHKLLFNGLTKRNAQYHIDVIGAKAGVPDLTAHRLRHTFGKNLVDAGEGLEIVAKLLGHSNINTTLIYTQPSEEDLIKSVDKIAWFE